MLSVPHLIIIFLVALVVLGPEKLPQVARVMGKAMADFRRITNEFRVQVEDEMRDLDRHVREREIATAAAAAQAATTLPPASPDAGLAEFSGETTPTESTPTEKPADGESHPA